MTPKEHVLSTLRETEHKPASFTLAEGHVVIFQDIEVEYFGHKKTYNYAVNANGDFITLHDAAMFGKDAEAWKP